jgi:hypothetical protein
VGNKGIELKMRLQYKVTRNLNLTSWLIVFAMASLAMPMAAQQLPATPDAVRKALNPPAPPKPGAGANAPSATAATPKQPQTSKPATSTNRAVKPGASANIPATGSSPTSSSKPAANASATATAKPAGKTAAKPAANTAVKPAADATAASKGESVGAGATKKPAPGLGTKSAASVTPSSAAKPSKPKPVTAAKSDVPSSVLNASVKPVAMRETLTRRDPFAPLLGRPNDGGGGSSLNLPPGKPGLLISSLRIDGIVSSPNGMIAIVSNAQERVYFLREGDRLFDGQVQHITMDGISFHQSGKDPFGNAVEREVAKRLNSTPGEQQ